MGGLSRRSLFVGMFTAPVAIAARMPLADKLGWWSVLRSYAWGISPVANNVGIDDDGVREMQGNIEAWQKWQAAHPFGRYKTEAGQITGRSKHALLEREIMREHGLPEFQEDSLMPYMRKALEDAGMYVFPPEQSYGECAAREFYGWRS